MALADVYEVRLSGTSYGVNWNMVFHAVRANSGFDAEDVKNAATQTWLDALQACMSSGSNTDSISVRSLGNALDFHEAFFGTYPGSRTGDPMPSFNAVAVRFTRRRTDMHHGYKRIPALSEADVTAGIISATLKGKVEDWADLLIGDWEHTASPGTPVANYIIVKRILDAGEYRLPQSDGELLYYAPANYQVIDAVSSQVSRKG